MTPQSYVFAFLISCACNLYCLPETVAASLNDVDAVPHLDEHGRLGYQHFLASSPPRAFAIASGGAWGYASEASNMDAAELQALANCQTNTQQRCLIYSRDFSVVLKSPEWIHSWGPYKSSKEAQHSQSGVHVGERFPDLQLSDDRGRPIRLNQLRGNVVVLHFWGSWCPPCKRELPALANLIKSAKTRKNIRFVLVQARESFATAQEWAKLIDRQLPLFDSGMKDSRDKEFKLFNGEKIEDRKISMVFPTSYVIDKHGIVVFSHTGPIDYWPELMPFLMDVEKYSGR